MTLDILILIILITVMNKQMEYMVVTDAVLNINEFLEFLFGDEEGYIYAPYKRVDGTFVQEWYSWPEDREYIPYYIVDNSKSADQYLAPALFNSRNTQDFKLSNVVWCDFDEGIPSELGDFPRPSIRIQSSTNSGKEHWYWRLGNSERSAGTLERYNKQLAYALGSDRGCWNFSRVLRPVDTLNHKYSPASPVSFLESSETVLDTYIL